MGDIIEKKLEAKIVEQDVNYYKIKRKDFFEYVKDKEYDELEMEMLYHATNKAVGMTTKNIKNFYVFSSNNEKKLLNITEEIKEYTPDIQALSYILEQHNPERFKNNFETSQYHNNLPPIILNNDLGEATN